MHIVADTTNGLTKRQDSWPFTLVQGPPGTGKTRIVWRMLMVLYLQKSLLLQLLVAQALIDATVLEKNLEDESGVRMVALFDHEEVESSSAQGADLQLCLMLYFASQASFPQIHSRAHFVPPPLVFTGIPTPIKNRNKQPYQGSKHPYFKTERTYKKPNPDIAYVRCIEKSNRSVAQIQNLAEKLVSDKLIRIQLSDLMSKQSTKSKLIDVIERRE
ncbi:Peptidase M18 [Cynara cardunculus var. scolymus]|uniref:Peptidase M18 n=1 Tax=Cynara cardunculus var. scolymus TaxID=59895 RepID=A0A103Y1D8_CYNCS|nr:Peptidase M18 [Cynara cardunculus var. scolymus]